MRTADLLDELRALTPTHSVYATAKLLGLQEDTVRNWYRAVSLPDAFAQTLIAQALDMPVELVMAIVEGEREKKPERRAYWEGLARKFAACVVMGTAITTALSGERSATDPGPRYMEPTRPGANDAVQIMRQLVAWAIETRSLRRLVQWLRGFGLAPLRVAG